MAASPAVQDTSEILSKLCKTTKLKQDATVHQNTDRLKIQPYDKLSIFLRHRNLFVVYRHGDGALAVLEDVAFKQRNPPVMSRGTKYHNFMDGVKMILSYAVVLDNWESKSRPRINLQKNDLVLIISWLLGDHCFGITKEYKVTQFPKKIVKLITKPRKFMKKGMTLRVESDSGEVLQLVKLPKTVFEWQTNEGVQLHLGQFQELCPEEGNPPPLPAPPLSSLPEFEDTSLWSNSSDSENDFDEIDYDAPPGGPSSCIDLELLDESFQDAGNYQELPGSTYRHSESAEAFAVQTLHQGTPPIEEGILRYAMPRRMRFQDDQPIRHGGGPKEREYMTIDYNHSKRKPVIFKTSFEQRGDEDHYYHQPEQLYVHYEEISQRHGKEQVTPALCETVADHLPEEKLVEFGKILGIPLNIRRQILETENSVQERTSRLMGVWLDRKGSDATVKVLLDALRRLGCEEIETLLEDLYENLEVQDNS